MATRPSLQCSDTIIFTLTACIYTGSLSTVLERELQTNPIADSAVILATDVYGSCKYIHVVETWFAYLSGLLLVYYIILF